MVSVQVQSPPSGIPPRPMPRPAHGLAAIALLLLAAGSAQAFISDLAADRTSATDDTYYIARDNKDGGDTGTAPDSTIVNSFDAINAAAAWDCGRTWTFDALGGAAPQDEGYSDNFLPGGFQFLFYGTQLPELRFVTNGYLETQALLADPSPDNTPMPNTAAPNNIIAVTWADWDGSVSGEFCDAVLPTPVGRVLAAKFGLVPGFNDPLDALNGMALLYEDGDAIELHFLDSDSDSGGNPDLVGIENSGGTMGINYRRQEADPLFTDHAIQFRPRTTYPTGMEDGYSHDCDGTLPCPTFVVAGAAGEPDHNLLLAGPAPTDLADVQIGNVMLRAELLGPVSRDGNTDPAYAGRLYRYDSILGQCTTTQWTVAAPMADGNFCFRPPGGSPCGDYTFLYRADDDFPNAGMGAPDDQDVARVTITLTNCNDAPEAPDIVVNRLEGQGPFHVNVVADYATDPNGDPLVVTEVENPDAATKGTPIIMGAAGPSVPGLRVRYAPLHGDVNDAFAPVGPDVFTYTVSDGRGGFDSGTITVFQKPVNDPPSFSDHDDPPAWPEVSAHTGRSYVDPTFITAAVPGPATATDEAGQDLTFVVTCKRNCHKLVGPADGKAAIVVNGDGDVQLSFTQAAFASTPTVHDEVVLCVVLKDDGGVEDGGEDTFPTLFLFPPEPCAESEGPPIRLRFDPINDLPVFSLPTLVTLTEDAGGATVLVGGIDQGGGEDEDFQTLNLSAVSLDTGRIPDPAVGFAPGDGLAFTHDAAEFLALLEDAHHVTLPADKVQSVSPYAEAGASLASANPAWENLVADRTPKMAGREFVVAGAENVDVQFAAPATAFGFWMVDEVDLFVAEPPCPASDSTFTVRLVADGAVVAVHSYAPPNNEPGFLGLVSSIPFDLVRIREDGSSLTNLQGPGCENDYFGPMHFGQAAANAPPHAPTATLAIEPLANATTEGLPLGVTVSVALEDNGVPAGVRTRNLRVNVQPINDQPLAGFGAPREFFPDLSRIENPYDSGPVTLADFLVGIDEGGGVWEDFQTLQLEVVSVSHPGLFTAAGQPALTGWSDGADTTADLAFTPKNRAIGTATVTVRVIDNGLGPLPDGQDAAGNDRVLTLTFTIRITSPHVEALPLSYPDLLGATNPLACAGVGGASEDFEFTTTAAQGLSCGVLRTGTFSHPLSYVIARPPDHGDLEVAPDGSLAYRPAANYSGVDTFEYFLQSDVDPEIYSNNATVTLDVAPRNDAPAFALADLTIDRTAAGIPIREDMPTVTLTGAAVGVLPGGGADEATQALTFPRTSLTTLSGAFAADAAFTLRPEFVHTVGAASALLRFTLAPDANGVFEACFMAKDSGLHSPALGHFGEFTPAEACITITVLAVDDAPKFTVAGPITVAETDLDTLRTHAGAVTGISAGAPDEAGQAIAWLLLAPEAPACTITPMLPAAPTLALDGTLSYTTRANACGSFTVQARLVQVDDIWPEVPDAGADAAGQPDSASDVANLLVTVTPVNDAPVAADDAYGLAHGLFEDSAGVTMDVLANDGTGPGDAGQTLAIAGTSLPLHGTLSRVTCGGRDCLFYVPFPAFIGTDSFTYEASDGQGGLDTATVALSIPNSPDLPTGVPDRYLGRPDRTLRVDAAGGLLHNDVETDGALLRAVLHTTPLHGELDLQEDGSFAYTPERGYAAGDAFLYRVLDDEGSSAPTLVTLDIRLNEPPVALFNTSKSTDRHGLHFFDQSSDDLGIVAWDWAFGDGTRSGERNPTHVFPRPGTYHIVLTVTDGEGATGTMRMTYAHGGPDGVQPPGPDDGVLPFADAGPDQSVLAGSVVQLAGSGPDGATYSWRQVAGAQVLLDGAGTARPSFRTPDVPRGGSDGLAFELVVTLGGRSSVADLVAIEVTGLPPLAMRVDLGPDRTVEPGQPLRLEATVWDAPGEVTYAWTQLSGPPVGIAGQEQAVAVAPQAPGTLRFSLTVTSAGTQATDEVAVQVRGGEGFRVRQARDVEGTVAFEPAADGLQVVAWDFGDGTTSTDAAPTHQYGASGRYDVRLTATTADGDEVEYTKAVAVTVPPPQDAQGGGISWLWVGVGAFALLAVLGLLVTLLRRKA